MAKLNFKYSDEIGVCPKLIGAVTALCVFKGKDCTCTSGYRSIERQKIINADSYAEHKARGEKVYQTTDGMVYTIDKKGNKTVWASAYGKSNHNYGLALDITDEWFKALKNDELKKFGLIKPMDYEPWHVELLETRQLTDDQKPVFYFQYNHGLVADGVVGPKTKAKCNEVSELINKILGGK